MIFGDIGERVVLVTASTGVAYLEGYAYLKRFEEETI
jgi:hypothetical protein